MGGRPPKGAARTLREIKARARLGLPITKTAVRDTSLLDRARQHFGSWARALVEAGFVPRARGGVASRKGARPKRARTHAEVDRLLRSSLGHREVAWRLGWDRRSVRRRRQRMGLSASGSPPTSRWLPAWRSKLGVMTNPEIAKVAGVSRWTVWMKARAMGYNGAPPRIVATAPLNWFPEHGHLLGVLPDAEIAKRAGVSTFTVSVARRKRGIRSSRRAWAPAPELAPLLGLLPDGEVARRAGVSRFMVIAARRNVGIPAAPHGTASRLVERARALPRSVLRRLIDRLENPVKSVLRALLYAERPVSIATVAASLRLRLAVVRAQEEIGVRQILVWARDGAVDRRG